MNLSRYLTALVTIDFLRTFDSSVSFRNPNCRLSISESSCNSIVDRVSCSAGVVVVAVPAGAAVVVAAAGVAVVVGVADDILFDGGYCCCLNCKFQVSLLYI
jgi:hypothetical protein